MPYKISFSKKAAKIITNKLHGAETLMLFKTVGTEPDSFNIRVIYYHFTEYALFSRKIVKTVKEDADLLIAWIRKNGGRASIKEIQ